MWTDVVWSGLAGGAAAWCWGALSWAMLPWHHATFRAFPADAEDALARQLLAWCPESGVYGLPAPPRHAPGATPQDRQRADERAHQQMVRGPVVTLVIQRTGFGSVPLAIARAFVIYVLTSMLLAWLLTQMTPASYWHSVGIVTAVGGVVALMARAVDWNWHGYSTSFTVVWMADHLIGAFVAGVVIALII